MRVSDAFAHGTVRFSLGRTTPEDQIGRVLDRLPGIVMELRTLTPLRG